MSILIMLAAVYCLFFLITLIVGFKGMKKAYHSKVKANNF